MSLAHTAYLLATDPDFRRALQTDPAAAVACQEGSVHTPEEQGLLAELRSVLSRSPQSLRGIVARSVRLDRWG